MHRADLLEMQLDVISVERLHPGHRCVGFDQTTLWSTSISRMGLTQCCELDAPAVTGATEQARKGP